MSLFGRIIARAALPGQAAAPVARPKGLIGGVAHASAEKPGDEDHAAPLSRATDKPDEDKAAPLRRAGEGGDGTESLQPLSRAVSEEQPPEDKTAPLHRAAEIKAHGVRA